MHTLIQLVHTLIQLRIALFNLISVCIKQDLVEVRSLIELNCALIELKFERIEYVIVLTERVCGLIDLERAIIN